MTNLPLNLRRRIKLRSQGLQPVLTPDAPKRQIIFRFGTFSSAHLRRRLSQELHDERLSKETAPLRPASRIVGRPD